MFNKNHVLALGILLIIVINVPLLFSNGDIYIGSSWDFLNSNVVWYKLLSENDGFFKPNSYVFESYMNTPRVGLPSDFTVLTWFTHFFGPFLAFSINLLLVQLVAFLGMFKLLNAYFIRKNSLLFPTLIACSFALLPFWQPGGISVAGIPLLVYCFININDNVNKWYYWLYCMAYCFYTVFFVFGFFVLFSLGIIYIYKSYKKQNLKIYPFAFLLLMLVLFIGIEWRIFYSTLINPSFVPHRDEFNITANLVKSIRNVYSSFIYGQDHVTSLHSPFIILTVLAAICSIIYHKTSKRVIYLILLMLSISIIHGFWNYEKFSFIKERIPILKSFQFDRFYILYPILWYVTFALSIETLVSAFENKKIIKYTLVFVCMSQLLLVINKNINFIGIKDLLVDKVEVYSFNEYYAIDTFDKIKADIGTPLGSFKTLSVGIPPAIAAFNQLQTLDGYSAMYPLDYKHLFRRIIDKELQLNDKSKKLFDTWGSTCYVFDDAVSRNFDNFKKGLSTAKLDLDFNLIKEMKGRYIISTYLVLDTSKLTLIKKYDDKMRVYFLYLIK